jgi:hypothetical protein
VTISGSCSGALRKFEKENQIVLQTLMIVCHTVQSPKRGHLSLADKNRDYANNV